MSNHFFIKSLKSVKSVSLSITFLSSYCFISDSVWNSFTFKFMLLGGGGFTDEPELVPNKS